MGGGAGAGGTENEAKKKEKKRRWRGPALRPNVFSMANEGLKRWRINGRSGVPVQH